MNTMLVYTCKHYARVKCRHSHSLTHTHTTYFAQSKFALYFVVAAVVAIVGIFSCISSWFLSLFFFSTIRGQYQRCSSSRSGYISNCTKMLNAKMCVRVCWSVMIVCIQSFTTDCNHHTEFGWDRKKWSEKNRQTSVRHSDTEIESVTHTCVYSMNVLCGISFYKIIWDLSWMRQFFFLILFLFWFLFFFDTTSSSSS